MLKNEARRVWDLAFYEHMHARIAHQDKHARVQDWRRFGDINASSMEPEWNAHLRMIIRHSAADAQSISCLFPRSSGGRTYE